jgi:hypothetical protein
MRPATGRVLVVARCIVAICCICSAAEACGSRRSEVRSGLTHIARAVERAHVAGSYRVRGRFGIDGPLLSWDGFVAGRDEQYVINTHGMLIESRRTKGANWARRVDAVEQWMRVPTDEPFDLAVLLRGREERVERDADGLVVTLRFDEIDVLAALTHIPSVGPTTARVTLRDGVIAAVVLELDGGARADITFREYGVEAAVKPPPVSNGDS